MTLPDQRYKAVLATERFLRALTDSKKTSRIPSEIRDQARYLLKHFPRKWDMDLAAHHTPRVFQSEDPPDELALWMMESIGPLQSKDTDTAAPMA